MSFLACKGVSRNGFRLDVAASLLVAMALALPAFVVVQASASPRAAAAQQSAVSSGKTASGRDGSALPPGPLQQKARTACLECHDAHIIVQQRLDKKAWAKEVDKMIRWGAVVDAKDRDAFIDYFSSHFAPDAAPAASH